MIYQQYIIDDIWSWVLLV